VKPQSQCENQGDDDGLEHAAPEVETTMVDDYWMVVLRWLLARHV
jgi:hypothetical protein